MRFSRIFRARIWGLAFCFIASACGQKDSHLFGQKNLSIACGQTDQYMSYMNPLDVSRTVSVSIDSKFSAAEQNRIHNALDTWNAQAQVNGKIMFQISDNAALSANSVPSNMTDCSYNGSSAAFAIVKVIDPDQWSDLGLTANNPGVTFRCAAGGGFITRQVVLLNTVYATIDKIQAVALHEIGHAYGMDHSCDFSNRGLDSWLSCTGLTPNHPYRDSVMYPVIESIGGGNFRTQLSPNDEERSACIMNYRP